MSLPLLILHSKSQETESGSFIFWPFLYCEVKARLQSWLMAQVSGMKLSLGISPSPGTCQQAPQSLAVDGELSPSYSVPSIFFPLDLKVICSHPVWGLWRELQRAASPPQVWELPISKGRLGEEAEGDGWGRGEVGLLWPKTDLKSHHCS